MTRRPFPGLRKINNLGSTAQTFGRGDGHRLGRHCRLLLAWAIGAALLVNTACSAPAISVPTQAGVLAPDLAPGALVTQQAVGGAPAGATGYTVLYRSTGPMGEPILVSGMIFVPAGAIPAAGRSVIAWAHPTTGIEPRCAPSRSPLRMLLIPGLGDMLRRGYVVAATDYAGLGSGTGTGGIHPFLDGPSEGYAVLDSVRAAIRLPGSGATARFAVWGHSQGGQAALFTGIKARRYAPDLTLTGVAATSPATDLATLFRATLQGTEGKNVGAMALSAWSTIYGAPLDQVVQPQAIPSLRDLARQCLGEIGGGHERAKAHAVLAQNFLSVPDLTAAQSWKSLLQRNSPGVLPRDVPVWIAQGDADQLVLPSVTRAYARALCDNGDRVGFLLMPGVKHGFAGYRSSKAAVTWLADRLDGAPVPDDCAALSGT
jgi:acetyl esterase/lipase